MIKESYVKYSHAQKTKRYDPYSRFFRWATNRLNENGILAFITNSSFIHSGEADGFRKVVSDEFSEIYIIDLGGDVRSNPKISGTKHNVFGIQAGVAISFMVKKELNDNNRCKIFYARRSEFETADEKLNFIATNKFNTISFEHITPDNNNNWMNLNYSDFYSLMPLTDKETKATNLEHEEKAVFKLFSFGVSTNRDEWVYDLNPNLLTAKIELFYNFYNKQIQDITKNSWTSQEANKFLDYSIKWSESLKINANNGKTTIFQEDNIVSANYRPYFKTYYYADFILSDRLTSIHTQLFGKKFGSPRVVMLK
ncbi:MAG: type ISP restriction/modification enzyme [Nostoc sp.]|uniref:type ISP restriction/modification enzyme n=1 Tax=Nostoc sp. TaxID=1180 RepID=UPI002FFD2C86